MTQSNPSTAYTEDQARTYDEQRFTSPGGRWNHAQELGMVRQATALIDVPEPVLEVGCGTGRLLLELARSGYGAHGIDNSEWMLRALAEKLEETGGTANTQVAEAAALPFPDDTFALTYSIRVLSLVENEDYAMRSLQEMIRVTRPGGYILAGILKSYRILSSVMRLSPQALLNTAASDTQFIWRKGAIFFGIPLYVKLPALGVSLLSPADVALSRCLPKLANQQYFLFRKNGEPRQD